jgi:hypothetical protein
MRCARHLTILLEAACFGALLVACGPGGVTAPAPAPTPTPSASPANNQFGGAPPASNVVTLGTDSNPGTPPGTGSGVLGDLRYAILNASAGATISFNTQTMCGAATCGITLSGPLPPIVQNLTIDGGSFGNVIIISASGYRVFWVDSGTVTLQNLEISDGRAQGGAGGNSGGGGAGLGGCLFVNQASAVVNVVNDYFLNCTAVGGSGGSGSSGNALGGGGGGLGASGGAEQSYAGEGGGGGGGGVVGAGFAATGRPGAAGGNGGGGGGGASQGFNQIFFKGGPGGAAYAGNTAGATGDDYRHYGPGEGGLGGGYNGGAGGFGGGGGGGGYGGNQAGFGGNGGFGGGGGGAAYGGPTSFAGDGGAGGGGGGGELGLGGPLATVSGGKGDNYGNAGGGAAAGPAIFVNDGTLTVTNSGAGGSSALGGAGGGGQATAGTSDSTPLFNYAGLVNGSATTGPIASALSGSKPTSIHRGR